MKKVLIINKGWADNLGDQVIKYSLESILEKNNIKTDFLDLTQSKETVSINYLDEAQKENNKSSSVNLRRKLINILVKYRFVTTLIWWKRNKGMFNKNNFKEDYDLIIIGGGQLIMGGSFFPLAIYLWIKEIRKNIKNPQIILLGVGVGGQFSLTDKILYNKIFKKVNTIYVRDKDSINHLKEEFKVTAKFIPDVGFFISKAYPQKAFKEDKVLIGIPDYLVYKKYNNNSITESDYLIIWEKIVLDNLEKYQTVKLFYTSYRDLAQSLVFKSYFYNTHKIELEIIMANSLEELLQNISVAKKIISGRMHGLIIGHAYNSEIETFVISKKLLSFKEQYEVKPIKINDIQKDIEVTVSEVLKSI